MLMVTLGLQQFVHLWRYAGCHMYLVLGMKEDESIFYMFGSETAGDRTIPEQIYPHIRGCLIPTK